MAATTPGNELTEERRGERVAQDEGPRDPQEEIRRHDRWPGDKKAGQPVR